MKRITPKRLGIGGVAVALLAVVYFYYLAALGALFVPYCGKVREPPICAQIELHGYWTVGVFAAAVLTAVGALGWGIARRRAARRRAAAAAAVPREPVDYRGLSSAR